MNNENKNMSDFNRISTENCKNGASLLSNIADQIRGDKPMREAIMGSQLYCNVYQLMMGMTARAMEHDRKSIAYDNYSMEDLMSNLYSSLSLFYNYGCAKGRETPGIEWEMINGNFTLLLGKCWINMEHSVTITERDKYGCEMTKKGIVVGVWLDVVDLDNDNPESYDPYKLPASKYVGFTVDFGERYGGREDVTFEAGDDDYSHREFIKSILADLDVIGEKA